MPDREGSPKPPVKNRDANGEDLRVIGVPRRRVDARAKVTGQTRFADDITLPRMAFCKLLRSPHPHARIRSIDTSRALAHPGVYLVLTGKDLPIEYGILPVSQDEQALCLDHVRHVGDPVAAVIAREELTALDALGSDRRRIRTSDDDLRSGRGAGDSLAAYSRLRRRRQHSQARVAAVRRRGSKLRGIRSKFSRILFSIRETRIWPSSSTLRWR